jgi:hypothetical protein
MWFRFRIDGGLATGFYIVREITLKEVVPSQEGLCSMEWIIVS